MRKLILVVVLLCFGFLLRAQLIINHNHTDITTLSEDDINRSKTVLHIAYGHTSHGRQVTDGMTGLVGFANGGGKGLSLPNNIFAWNNGGTGGALDLHDYAMGGDVGYYPQWYNNTVNYLNNPANSDVNVIMWSWCGQASGYSEQNMIDYFLNPMTLLETNYRNVKFVYMTGHLDGTGVNGNLNRRNQQIRDYCSANNKILYDFADIESYDPDQLTNYMLLNATDECWYDSDNNGSRDKNWATEWQNTHTQNVDWYNCSCAHSQPLNGNQKAYAAWHMFVAIARQIVLESIPENHTVSDTLVGNEESACFDATQTLTVAGDEHPVVIQNGGTAEFISGNSISFMPGFYAAAGSLVQAFITLKDGFCNFIYPVPAPDAASQKSAPVLTEKSEQIISPDIPELKLFPNPNNGRFRIAHNLPGDRFEMAVCNSQGMVVFKQKISQNTEGELSLPSLPQGLYFLRMEGSKNVKSTPFLIE